MIILIIEKRILIILRVGPFFGCARQYRSHHFCFVTYITRESIFATFIMFNQCDFYFRMLTSNFLWYKDVTSVSVTQLSPTRRTLLSQTMYNNCILAKINKREKYFVFCDFVALIELHHYRCNFVSY